MVRIYYSLYQIKPGLGVILSYSVFDKLTFFFEVLLYKVYILMLADLNTMRFVLRWIVPPSTSHVNVALLRDDYVRVNAVPLLFLNTPKIGKI